MERKSYEETSHLLSLALAGTDDLSLEDYDRIHRETLASLGWTPEEWAAEVMRRYHVHHNRETS